MKVVLGSLVGSLAINELLGACSGTPAANADCPCTAGAKGDPGMPGAKGDPGAKGGPPGVHTS